MPKQKIDVRLPSNLCSKRVRRRKLSPIELGLEMKLDFSSAVINSIKACSSLSRCLQNERKLTRVKRKKMRKTPLVSPSSRLFSSLVSVLTKRSNTQKVDFTNVLW